MKIKLNYSPLSYSGKIVLEDAPKDLSGLISGLKTHLKLADEKEAPDALKISGTAIEITTPEGKSLFPLLKEASRSLLDQGQISPENYEAFVKSVNDCIFILGLDFDHTCTAVHTYGLPVATEAKHMRNQFKQPEKLAAFLRKMHRIGHFIGIATDGVQTEFVNENNHKQVFGTAISGAESVRRHFEALLGPDSQKIISSIQAFDATPETVEIKSIVSCSAEHYNTVNKFLNESKETLEKIWTSPDDTMTKYDQVADLQEKFQDLTSNETRMESGEDPQGNNGKLLHCIKLKKEALEKSGIVITDPRRVMHVDDSEHNYNRTLQGTTDGVHHTGIKADKDPFNLDWIDQIEGNIMKLTPEQQPLLGAAGIGYSVLSRSQSEEQKPADMLVARKQ